jgi:hypothetical protein
VSSGTLHLPHIAVRDSVWALPVSVAPTQGISVDFSSSPYSDASLREVHHRTISGSITQVLPWVRSLIRVSSDRRPHASPRGLSQLATPFIVTQAKPSTRWRRCTHRERYVKACAFLYMALIAGRPGWAASYALHHTPEMHGCILHRHVGLLASFSRPIVLQGSLFLRR